MAKKVQILRVYNNLIRDNNRKILSILHLSREAKVDWDFTKKVIEDYLKFSYYLDHGSGQIYRYISYSYKIYTIVFMIFLFSISLLYSILGIHTLKGEAFLMLIIFLSVSLQ